MFEHFTSFTGFLRAKIGTFIDFNNLYQKSNIDPLYSSIIPVHFVLGLILWPLKNLKVAARAPKISLGQNYLTTSTLFDPSYNSFDQHRDLKKLTGSIVGVSNVDLSPQCHSVSKHTTYIQINRFIFYDSFILIYDSLTL